MRVFTNLKIRAIVISIGCKIKLVRNENFYEVHPIKI